MIEKIEELIGQRRILQFPSYNGSQRELTYYQDDQSAQTSAAELRNAREDRRRQLERENAKPKPHIILQEMKRAKELEKKRTIDEDKRELREKLIRVVKRNRNREEEEKRVRQQESYRIVKERFTPAQIFRRKFPHGRPLNPSSEDYNDNDPFNFRNLRKAVKRGWWETEN